MKQFLSILFLAICAIYYVNAQEKKLVFTKTSHSFGTIAEDGGKVSHSFTFRKVSDKPLVIIRSSVSCGCTDVKFTRKPLIKDSIYNITVTFDPMNQPGPINRNIDLHLSDKSIIHLNITGNVTPRKKSTEEEYPIVLGEGVRSNGTFYSFGFAEHGKRRQSAINIINTSPKEIHLEIIPASAGCSLFKIITPPKISPEERTAINFEIDLPDNSSAYGTFDGKYDIVINGIKSRYQLSLTALAVDNRDNTPDTEYPDIELTEKFINFGVINSTSILPARKVSIINRGAFPLRIRKIEYERGFITILGESTNIIKPYSTLEIEIGLTEKCRSSFGIINDKIRFITDDPAQPLKVISTEVVVTKD